MGKKVLVLGATGAMAVYLIPELLKKGYTVDGVSLDDVKSDNENLRYIKADAKNIDFLKHGWYNSRISAHPEVNQ